MMHIVGVKIFQPWYRLYPIFRLSKYHKIAEKSKIDGTAYMKRVRRTQAKKKLRPKILYTKCALDGFLK